MDFYTFLKFLHVALATLWLGGTLAGTLYGVWVWRRGTVGDMGLVMRQSGLLAGAVFGPATLAVPALGAWMTWQRYDFTDGWIVLALAALVAHVGIGYRVVMPRFKALEATAREGRLAEADRAPFGWLMRMGIAHEVLLQAVVLDMVARPQWSDPGLIGAIAVIAALGFAHMAIPMQVRGAD